MAPQSPRKSSLTLLSYRRVGHGLVRPGSTTTNSYPSLLSPPFAPLHIRQYSCATVAVKSPFCSETDLLRLEREAVLVDLPRLQHHVDMARKRVRKRIRSGGQASEQYRKWASQLHFGAPPKQRGRTSKVRPRIFAVASPATRSSDYCGRPPASRAQITKVTVLLPPPRSSS